MYKKQRPCFDGVLETNFRKGSRIDIFVGSLDTEESTLNCHSGRSKLSVIEGRKGDPVKFLHPGVKLKKLILFDLFVVRVFNVHLGDRQPKRNREKKRKKEKGRKYMKAKKKNSTARSANGGNGP